VQGGGRRRRRKRRKRGMMRERERVGKIVISTARSDRERRKGLG